MSISEDTVAALEIILICAGGIGIAVRAAGILEEPKQVLEQVITSTEQPESTEINVVSTQEKPAEGGSKTLENTQENQESSK